MSAITITSPFRSELKGKLMPAALLPLPSARPLVQHKLAAGFPSPAADYVEKGLNLNTFLVQHKEASFFLKWSVRACRVWAL